jgi:hypothetical protein
VAVVRVKCQSFYENLGVKLMEPQFRTLRHQCSKASPILIDLQRLQMRGS